jgi:hypothetical protein
MRCRSAERLLASRIAICWYDLHLSEPSLLGSSSKPLPLHQAEFFEKRRDRAHRRYLAALKTLAQVRRLSIPDFQLNIAKNQINQQFGHQLNTPSDLVASSSVGRLYEVRPIKVKEPLGP